MKANRQNVALAPKLKKQTQAFAPPSRRSFGGLAALAESLRGKIA
jgi:hypothetical protein